MLGRFGKMAARGILIQVVLATVAGAVLFSIVDFVELGNLAAETATTSELGKLSLFNLPRVIRTLLPIAAPIGVLTGLGALVRRREIEALISSGGSPFRVLAPVVIVGLLAAGIHLANNEWLVPPSTAQVSAIRTRLGLSSGALDKSGRQTWFRGRDRLLRVAALADVRGATLEGVTILRVAGGEISERWDVTRMVYDAEVWTGTGVVHRHFDGEGLLTERFDTTLLELDERPEDFVLGIASPERLPLAELIRTAEARERLGRAANLHHLEIARRICGPIGLVLAMMLAAAIALRLGRRQTTARALGVGAVIGSLTWLGSELASLFGASGAAHPSWVVASVPAVLSCAAAVAWFRAGFLGVSEG